MDEIILTDANVRILRNLLTLYTVAKKKFEFAEKQLAQDSAAFTDYLTEIGDKNGVVIPPDAAIHLDLKKIVLKPAPPVLPVQAGIK